MNKIIQFKKAVNVTPELKRSYTNHVINFLVWLEKEPEHCTQFDVLNYLIYLRKEQKGTFHYCYTALTAIRRYFNFLKLPEPMAWFEYKNKTIKSILR